MEKQRSQKDQAKDIILRMISHLDLNTYNCKEKMQDERFKNDKWVFTTMIARNRDVQYVLRTIIEQIDEEIK